MWKPAQEMENALSIAPLQRSKKLPITVEVENVPGAGVQAGCYLEHAASAREQAVVDSVMEPGSVNFAMEKEWSGAGIAMGEAQRGNSLNLPFTAITLYNWPSIVYILQRF